MDFLKSLMLYMTLTFAASVQNAPAPEVTPEPIVTPPAVVETYAPEITPEAIVPPVESATPTPPPTNPAEPTITPNPAYRNLKQGDKGDRVKALQERLIELGYLTGKADGVFGRQTYRAVLEFQTRNGLSRDGVAGDATQTHLFENADVVPAATTPTPPPTETPTEAPADPTIAPPQSADIPKADIPAEDTGLMPLISALPQAKIVMNDSGMPLACLRQEDGVTIASKPRVWSAEGQIMLALSDLAASLENWTLTREDNGVLRLTAAGYDVVLTPADAAYLCTVDGKTVALSADDVMMIDDTEAVSPAFLRATLAASTEWDNEEYTLMIHLQEKSVAQATD